MSCNFYGLTIYYETLHQLLSLNSDREPDVLLPQFKPLWGKFLTKFILFYVTYDLSDNLTEMCQTGLS